MILYNNLFIHYYLKIYRLLNPVLKRLDKSKQKELESQIQKQFDPVEVYSIILTYCNTCKILIKTFCRMK